MVILSFFLSIAEKKTQRWEDCSTGKEWSVNLTLFFCPHLIKMWKQTRKYTWYYVPLMFSEMYVYVIYNIFKLCLI